MRLDQDCLLTTTGSGHEQLHGPDGEVIQHHRLILWAHGELDSVWFDEDAREVHHVEGVAWINGADVLLALTPAEHMEKDDGRARIETPWDDVGRSEA